jgi:hypothetical protein
MNAEEAKVLTARLAIFDCITEGEHADPEKCGVTPEEFMQIVEDMDQDHEGLIDNVKYSIDGRGKKLVAFLNTAVITPKGESYIDYIVTKHG